MKWNDEEINYLINNYNTIPSAVIADEMGKTKSAISSKASCLNLKSGFINNKKCNINFLLNDKLESFYWIGYLLADGSFTNNRSIKLTSCIKDESHLIKFASLANAAVRNYKCGGYLENRISCEVNCYDYKLVPEIINKFGIFSRKTYNPPDFKKYSFKDEQFLSLIIGFIDGDGCISLISNKKYFRLTIQTHSTWLSNIQLINEFIHYFFNEKVINKIKIDKRGYVSMSIAKQNLLRKLKDFTKKNNLPVLERKWSLIN